MLKGSLLRSQRWNSAEILTHPSFYSCPRCLQNEKDQSKNEGSRVLTRFSPLQVYVNFFQTLKAGNSAVRGRILPNFEFVRDIMVVLHTCKNEEDPKKNEGTRVLTRLYVVYSDSQGQLNPKSAVEFCRNLNSSKLL